MRPRRIEGIFHAECAASRRHPVDSPQPVLHPLHDARLSNNPPKDRIGTRVPRLRVTAYAFALCSFLATAGANLSAAALLAGTIAQARTIARCLPRREIVLLGLMGAFLAVTAITAYLNPAGAEVVSASSQWRDWLRLGLPLAFWTVAWGTRGNERVIVRMLVIASSSFLLGCLFHLDARSWHQLIAGARVDINFTILAVAEYSAAVVVGGLCLLPRFWSHHPSKPFARWLTVSTWTLFMVPSVYLMVITRSRGVWLALAIILPLLGGWAFVSSWRNARDKAARRRTIRRTTIWSVAMVVALGAMMPVLIARMDDEARTLNLLTQGELNEIPGTHSIGIRLAMWEFGLERFGQRPWTGWGPGATPALMQSSERAALAGFDDLHSAPIEMLLRTGILGSALLSAIVLWVLGSLYQSYRLGHLSRPVFLALLGLILLHLLAALTNFRMLNTDWRFYWWLVMGLAYGCALRPERTPS